MPGKERCQNKEFFGPWLVRQINSRKYEGVYWLDEGRTLFRLPWKHLNIRHVDEKDIAIFKAWAMQSGKYNPPCEDLSTYKTNFRCALKAVTYKDRKMFSEVKDNKSDPRDPHKIFKFHGVHDSSPAVDLSTVSPPTTEGRNFHNEMEHDDYRLRISPDVERSTPFISPQESQDSDFLEQFLHDGLLTSNENDALQVFEILQDYSQDLPRVDQLFREQVNVPNLALPHLYTQEYEQSLPNHHSQLYHDQCSQYQRCGMYQNGPIENTTAVDQVFQQIPACSQLQPAPTASNFVETLFEVQGCQHGFQQESTQHMVNNEVTTLSPNYDCNTNGEMSGIQSPQVNTPSTINEHGSPDSQESAATLAHQASTVPKLTSWEVTVFYRGKEVLKQNVSRKFSINYTGHYPLSEAQDIVTFPPTNDILADQIQVYYTDKILNSLGDGLLLDVSPHDLKLYGTRMGNARVYWGMSQNLEPRRNVVNEKKLDRNVPTAIFDFNQFVQELKDYKCHQRSSPDYTVYLSFGQSLFEPIKKALVLVKLVPNFCTFWHQRAQLDGASSLHNELISLQISNGNSFSCFDVPDIMDLDLSDFPDLL